MKLPVFNRIGGALITALCLGTLFGCAATPGSSSVVSKNDGAFEENMTVAATAPLEEQITNTETFLSNDGTAEYCLHLDQEITSDPLPVVEVVPQFFTGGDVQRIAQVLFGNADFHEREPEENARYSKSQLQKRINWMTEIANPEAMASLWGDTLSEYSDQIDLLKRMMQQYTVQMENAPEENPHKICDWTYKNDRNYSAEINTTGNPTIFATVDLGDVNYKIYSQVRDKSDYKLNRVTVQFGDGLGYNEQEMRYYQAKLCRTAKPDAAQLESLKEKAQTMLDAMGMGQWQISVVNVLEEDYGGVMEYQVQIYAVPVFQGIPAVYGQRIRNLTSEDANAANYFFSSVEIHFSANGDLLYFCMDAPVKISSVVNEEVAILSVDELMRRAKEHLALFGVSEQKYSQIIWSYYDNNMTCKVDVDRIEFGLARINAANRDFTYYYTPAFALYGTVRYYDAQSGDYLPSPFPEVENEQPLVWINAVDGSIVESD